MATVARLETYGNDITILFSDGSRRIAFTTGNNFWLCRPNTNGVVSLQTFGNQIAIIFTDGRHVLAYPFGDHWYVGPHPDYDTPPVDLWYWPFPISTFNIFNGFPKDGFRTPERPTHNGLDMGFGIANITDTPIKCVHSGIVLFTGFEGSYGNRVRVLHNSVFETTYSHMNTPAYVSVNDNVSVGTVLGGIGTTGGSTGNHLHFEVYNHAIADYVDPILFMQEYNPTNLIVP